MTPAAPTWGDVGDFLAADGWREVPGGERSGSRRRHIFYEKVLPDSRVLGTHVSHSRQKTMSPGRFNSLLHHDLEVSKNEFWDCVRTGKPVDRPVTLGADETVQHEAWVIAVLVSDLHLTPDELEALSPEEAQALVLRHWAGG